MHYFFSMKKKLHIWEKATKKYIYSGKRLYQYNEDDPSDFNFNLYQELLNLKSFSFITCKLLIQKKLVNNQNLNRKFVFIVLVNRLPMWKSKKEVRIIWQIKEKCRTSYFSLWKIQKLESITELKEKVLKFRNRSKIRRIRINLRKIQNQRKYQD